MISRNIKRQVERRIKQQNIKKEVMICLLVALGSAVTTTLGIVSYIVFGL
jgi:hypothetical protein